MKRALPLLVWLIVVLTIVSMLPTEATANHCDTSWSDVVNLIGYYADDVFKVDKRVLYAVAGLESGTNHCRNGQVVTGDGGHSVGVFQLHDGGAWHDWNNPYRHLGLNARHDAEINVAFSAWYLARYKNMCPWTAYRVAYPQACR